MTFLNDRTTTALQTKKIYRLEFFIEDFVEPKKKLITKIGISMIRIYAESIW